MRKQTRPCTWHLNSARPGYFGKRVARGWPWAGPEPSPSLLSLSTKRICNNHHDGTILIPLQLIFLLICDMTRNSNWFVLQFRCRPWQKVWKMNLTEPALQNSVDRQDRIFCQNENLATIVGWNFGNVLVPLPIFSNMLIAKHAQSPSSCILVD